MKKKMVVYADLVIYTVVMSAEDSFKQAEKKREEERLEEALTGYLEGSEKAANERNDWLSAESLHMAGLVCLQLERNAEANDMLARAKEKFNNLNDQSMAGAVLRDQAAVAAAENNLELAEALAKKSIELLEQTDKKGHLGISRVKLGAIYRQQGNLESAEMVIKQGLSEISQSNDRFFESSGYFELAQVQKAAGLTSQAKESGEVALNILEETAPGDLHRNRKKMLREFIDSLN